MVFLGNLWSLLREVKQLVIIDGKCVMALEPMQGNQASSPGEGEVLWLFSSCSRNLGYILELQRGWPFKTHVSSAT